MAISEELKLVVKAEVSKAVQDLKKFDTQVDRTEKSGGKLSDTFKKFGASLLAAGGAFFAINRLVSFMKDSLRAWGEQEQAVAKLASAIKATGREAEISVYGLGEYASALQRVTTHGDEAIISAMTMLQQLGDLDERGLKQVTKGTLDFADAMGVDLQTAASLIGKTLGSGTNALSRYGVTLDMSKSKTEKLAELTSVLEKKFGGMAEAVAQTATGSIVQLKNAMGDLQEQMGKVSAQGMQPFVQWLTKLATAANIAYERMGLVGDALAGVSRETDLGKLQAELKAINEAIEIAQKGGARGQQFRMKEYLANLEKAKESVGRQIQLEDYRQAQVRATTKAEKEKYAALAAAEEEAIKRAKWMDDAFAATTAGKIAAAGAQLAAHKQNLAALEAMNGNTERAAQVVKELQTAYDELTKSTDNVDDSLQRITDIYMRMGDTTDYTDYGLAAIKAANEELTKVKENLQVNADFMTGPLQDAYLALSEGFGTLVNQQIDGIEMVKRVFKDMIIAMLKGLAQVLLVQAGAMALLNPAGAAALVVAAGAAHAGAGVVSQLAKGGIVTQPTLAMVGEKGPEAVIPLSRGGGVGQTIIYNIRGSLITEKEVSKRITKRQAQFNRGF